MSDIGWLVNDCLTCIPGTKTLWHDLLDWVPDLQDKTYYQSASTFANLANDIRTHWLATPHLERPRYIIRNGTFFGCLNLHSSTTPPSIISLIQDVMPIGSHLRNLQIEAAAESNYIVFNSEFTKQQYPELHNKKHRVIPIGVDFNFFDKLHDVSKMPDVLTNSILFVGAANNNPKGWDRVERLISETTHNFCLVMKDGYSISHPRVRCFNLVNQDQMLSIYNSCKVLICTSRIETQHLAGIEAAACKLPLVATDVGIYRTPGCWGIQVKQQDRTEQQIVDDFKASLITVFGDGTIPLFTPRATMLQQGYDKESCAIQWKNLIYECTYPHH